MEMYWSKYVSIEPLKFQSICKSFKFEINAFLDTGCIIPFIESVLKLVFPWKITTVTNGSWISLVVTFLAF